MSALWVLAPVGVVAACALAAWYLATGRSIEALFRTLDPPEITIRLTDGECDALFDEITARMARKYLSGGGDLS